MNKLILTFAAVASLSASARVSDGLYFDLKSLGDLNGNGTADLSEVVNAMAVGAAGGGAATYGRDLSFSTETAWRSFFNLASPERSAVNIRQSYYEVDAGGGVMMWKSRLNALVFQNPAATASCANGRTMFCRFRWDGYAYPNPDVSKNQMYVVTDSWNKNGQGAGYGFCLDPLVNAPKVSMKVLVGVRDNAVKRDYTLIDINSNQWYDIVFRLTTDGSKTYVKTAVGQSGGYQEWNSTGSFGAPLTADPNGRLIIGGESYDNYVLFAKDKAAPKQFNGRIAELKLWNRALSDDELNAVFRNVSGETMTLGAANGSSDEFGAEPAEVYDPRTMEWSKMRKELTAEHPSLNVEMAFKPEESEIGKALLLTPVLKDTASCDVELLVNGQVEVEATLTDGVETPLRIRKRAWKAGADGRIYLELRRTGSLTGTLGIDALSFGGSWQLGLEDNDWSDFAYELGKDAFNDFYVGDSDTTNHLRRATYEVGGSASPTKVFLDFYCPPSMTDLKSTLTVRLLNKANPVSAAIPYVFTVNRLQAFNALLAQYDTVTIEIPAGTFKPGFNFITVEHVAADAGAWSGSETWAGMDFYRLQFEDPKRGMSLIVK